MAMAKCSPFRREAIVPAARCWKRCCDPGHRPCKASRNRLLLALGPAPAVRASSDDSHGLSTAVHQNGRHNMGIR